MKRPVGPVARAHGTERRPSVRTETVLMLASIRESPDPSDSNSAPRPSGIPARAVQALRAMIGPPSEDAPEEAPNDGDSEDDAPTDDD